MVFCFRFRCKDIIDKTPVIQVAIGGLTKPFSVSWNSYTHSKKYTAMFCHSDGGWSIECYREVSETLLKGYVYGSFMMTFKCSLGVNWERHHLELHAIKAYIFHMITLMCRKLSTCFISGECVSGDGMIE